MQPVSIKDPPTNACASWVSKDPIGNETLIFYNIFLVIIWPRKLN